MQQHLAEKIAADPNYQALKSQRLRFGWTLTALMLIVYYGFILLIAFGKGFLATPLGAGVITLGMPIAFGVILITLLLTAIYIHRANSKYDAIVAKIREDAGQ